MARERRRRPGLDQPRERGLSLRPSVDEERVGRLSEKVARYLGSWVFIGQMTVFIVVWIAWNLLAPEVLQFDPWVRGLVLLTLILSLQASYAAPLILLAQNRQADRDRVTYAEDRARTDRLVADTEYLTREIAALRAALGDVATRDFVRGELRELVEILDEQSTGLRRELRKTRKRTTRPENG